MFPRSPSLKNPVSGSYLILLMSATLAALPPLYYICKSIIKYFDIMKRLLFLFLAAIFITGATANAKDASGTLTVQGKCNMCKTNIEKAAKSISGVRTAEWNKDTKVLTLRYDADKVKLESISKAIAKAGYDTNRDKASAEKYEALPNCCKYR
jgi:copper chaperone CopZ